MQVRDIDPSTITLIVYRGRELRFHGDDRWFLAMHVGEEVQPTSGGYVGEEFQITAQHPPRQDPIIR